MVRMFEFALFSIGLHLCVSAESDQHILQEFEKMRAEMAELKKSNEIMSEEMRELKAIVRQKSNTGVQRNKRVLSNYGVSFSAELGSHLHKIVRGQPIVYDRVHLNYGNGYNSSNGIFVVPLDGVYVFYWNLMTDSTSALDTTLMSSRSRLADGYAHAGSTERREIAGKIDFFHEDVDVTAFSRRPWRSNEAP
ncbi:hypothetical protein KP79_PYT01918 [Mizuhopecten yessoensis]|uniref:C1q domain-containing protein n=1 Tax=Mizuhopecten yessoensis TaxID=6573 RepID=A0A210Q311_MIZYE|nr:hypothetical protein KP79_PYT01918 [Mizuhopecten yessoensis]